MRSTIKKILREENHRIKKYLKDIIHKNGIIFFRSRLDKIAYDIGLSKTDVVKLSEIPIDTNIANSLIYEHFNTDKIPSKYNEFIINIQPMSGAFQWSYNGNYKNYDEYAYILATPFWEGEKTTPVELYLYELLRNDVIMYKYEPEGDIYDYYNFDGVFESVESVFDWYNDVYLPNVYYEAIRQIKLAREHSGY